MGGLRHLDTREVEAENGGYLACHQAENLARLSTRRQFVTVRESITAVRPIQALCPERSAA